MDLNRECNQSYPFENGNIFSSLSFIRMKKRTLGLVIRKPYLILVCSFVIDKR